MRTPKTKVCTKCGKRKKLGDFHKSRVGKYGLRSRCKQCINTAHKNWQLKNSDEIKEYNKIYHRSYYEKNKTKILQKMRTREKNLSDEDREKRRTRQKKYTSSGYRKTQYRNNQYYRTAHWYGITKEFALELHNKQDGKCAICGKREKRLCIDHDHVTGKVRGLLCHGCNLGIGNLQDNPEILTKAAKYLRKHGR